MKYQIIAKGLDLLCNLNHSNGDLFTCEDIIIVVVVVVIIIIIIITHRYTTAL